MDLNALNAEALLPTAGQPLPPVVQPPKLSNETVVSRAAHRVLELVYIRDADLYYYKDDDFYKRLTDDELMVITRDIWEKLFGDGWSAQSLKRAMEKVQMATTNRIETMDKQYVKVGQGLFWDIDLADFVDEVPEGHTCFARLFDSAKESSNTLLIPPPTPEQIEIIRGWHQSTLQELNKTGDLKERYQFITDWAVGDHDVYMDMLKCHAFTFMSRSRHGSPILIGSGANGKSTYLDLIHSIWGRNNTTGLTMKQMADKHHQLSLAYSFMNAPDEEQEYSDKEKAEVQRVFKVFSARGELRAEVMFSQNDKGVEGNFVSFFPMNHKPTWTGTGAKALVRRSMIVPFNADFTRMAAKGTNFLHDTFHPELIYEYLGVLLGIASYYHGKEMPPSASMARYQASLLAETDSAMIYKREFELFFDSFQTFDTLYTDYQNWCRAMDYPAKNRDSLKWAFDAYLNRNRVKCRKEFSTWDQTKGKRLQPLVYRARPLAKHKPLLDRYHYECGWLHNIHNENVRDSIVRRMADEARELYGDNYQDILGKAVPVETLKELKQPRLGVDDDIFKEDG